MSKKAQSSTRLNILLLLGLLYEHVNFTFQNDGVSLQIKARLNRNVTVNEVFTISANEDYILSQFQHSDGSVFWLLYDFFNGIKVFKMDVLGEPELGQKQYQSMCFLTILKKDDIIPSEAMAKLRQKTTGTVQEPNDILKNEVIRADVELLNLKSNVKIFPGKFRQMCLGQHSIVYARDTELYAIAKDENMLNSLKSRTHKYTSNSELPGCSSSLNVLNKLHPCVCKVPFAIAWYPCSVKYCQKMTSSGNTITTRCGIRSCGKTFQLHFITSHPLSCHTGIT